MKTKIMIVLTLVFISVLTIASFLDEESIPTTFHDKETQFIGEISTKNGSPLLGSLDAPVTIIEFGDYQCPNCKKWFLETKPVIVENFIDTGKVNLVFVDIAFLGKDSPGAAMATYCAEDQGKYWEYHGYLYTNQIGIDTGWANYDSLKSYALDLGLDTDQFVNCLDSGKYQKRVDYNTREAADNTIAATPTFLIVGPNGQTEKIVGPQPFSVFKNVIELML